MRRRQAGWSTRILGAQLNSRSFGLIFGVLLAGGAAPVVGHTGLWTKHAATSPDVFNLREIRDSIRREYQQVMRPAIVRLLEITRGKPLSEGERMLADNYGVAGVSVAALDLIRFLTTRYRTSEPHIYPAGSDFPTIIQGLLGAIEGLGEVFVVQENSFDYNPSLSPEDRSEIEAYAIANHDVRFKRRK